jgi:hypothetical protein
VIGQQDGISLPSAPLVRQAAADHLAAAKSPAVASEARSLSFQRRRDTGSTRERLALDDVVDFEQFRLPWLYAHVGKQRHEALPERVELLP